MNKYTLCEYDILRIIKAIEEAKKEGKEVARVAFYDMVDLQIDVAL